MAQIDNGQGAGDGQFASPVALEIDASDNIYVTTTTNNRLQKFDSSRNFVWKSGGPGSTDGLFSVPLAIEIDTAGNVFVADFANDRVQQFSSSGIFLTKWGTTGTGNGDLDGPYGLAFDSSGDLYVSDRFNSLIQVFSPPPAVPDAPVDVTATGSSSSATIYWPAPASNRAAITLYTVTSNPGGFTATSSTATSTVVTGLTSGTSYTFTVTATNSVGTGAVSAASNVVIPGVAPAGPVGQLVKLKASDFAASDELGIAVAISGDTAVVGAFGDSDEGSFTGSAYVYIRTAGIWAEQQKLTADDAEGDDRFGSAVAISGDTVVVGSPRDGGFNTGSAYVYVRADGVWSQQARLTASDSANGDEFGYSVAISGSTVLVGSPFQDTNGSSAGAAYAFVRSGTSWSEQQKLIADDGAGCDNFGGSVGISGDIAAIGARCDGGCTGSAYVFVRDGSSWSE